MSTAVQQAPGLFRTDVQRHDLSVSGREVIQNRVDIGPEAPFVRHKHPGEEIIYVLEGTAEIRMSDVTQRVGADTAVFCPPGVLHGIRNAGNTPIRYMIIRTP